jgi:hypothetical protein
MGRRFLSRAIFKTRYFAVSTNRVSLMTVTLTSPGN